MRGRDALDLEGLAAVDAGNGSMAVVAATVDGAVLVSECSESGAWSSWTDLRAAVAAWSVAAVSPTHGVIEYFAIDRDGALRMLRSDRGQHAGWIDVRPGGASSGRLIRIAATSLKAGHREIYAVTGTGRMQHTWKWDGEPWSDWYDSTLGQCVDVTTCSPKDDLLECFVVDRDGAVWHRWFWSDHWRDWEPWGRPDTTAKAISAFRKATDEQEVFVVGQAGDLTHRWHAGGQPWSPWARLETPAELTDLATGTISARHLHCLGIDRRGQLWQRSYREQWTPWREIGISPP